MKILEEIVIKDSIEINASPESVFEFLVNMTDDESYRNWHPEDHISLRWLKGKPWEVGSVVCAKEYIHGVIHTFKFVTTKMIPNRLIEYMPTFCLYRIFIPKNSFIIEPTSIGCIFTAEGSYRIGRIGKLFAKNKIEKGIASMKKHLQEEGENLKRSVENKNL
jgi:Polyketide cyclase / dehydrase and lipid transport